MRSFNILFDIMTIGDVITPTDLLVHLFIYLFNIICITMVMVHNNDNSINIDVFTDNKILYKKEKSQI